MLNQTVLVGRIVDTPSIIETENGKSYAQLTLAIPRSYKNENGEYETDFVDFVVWENIAKNTMEYVKKGDLVGIKGRLQSTSFEDKKGNRKSKLEVVAEKVTFLSTKEHTRSQNEQER